MNPSSDRVIIAANPHSGAASSRAKVSELQERLIQRGYRSQIVESLPEVQQLAAKYHQDGSLRTVVSAGGDGTVAALANLLESDVPLLVFPLGTENLLAKYLRLTNDTELICNAVAHGKTSAIDVGRANGKLFLVMLSCGFDAEVVRQMDAIRTGHINRWSYTGPILKTLQNYQFPSLRIEHSGGQITEAAWLFAFNVPKYAAGLQFCPQADPRDGQLDLCTFRRPGILNGLLYFLKLRFQQHQRARDFSHQLFDSLRIPAPLDASGKEIDIPFQLDGDPGGSLPLEVDILPQRLLLLHPPPH